MPLFMCVDVLEDASSPQATRGVNVHVTYSARRDPCEPGVQIQRRFCSTSEEAHGPEQPVVDQYLPVWARQQAFGSKPAFIWADDDRRTGTSLCTTALTYSQLNAAVRRMARSLLETVTRGDTVLLLASPGLCLVKLIFACQRAALVAVPIIPPHPSAKGSAHRHVLRAVSQTRPAAAVADARYIKTLMNSPASAAPKRRA
jgi:hypothetical protein